METLKAADVIQNFFDELEKIRGVFADVKQGLFYYHHNLVESRKQSLNMLARTNPQIANAEYLDKQLSFYSEELDPLFLDGKTTKHNLTTLNYATQGELLKRTSDGGEDYFELSNWIIVLIYHLWENKYRELISISLGYPNKEEFIVPIFGDLRLLRNSILKKQGYAIDKLESKSEIIKYFKHGDKILLTTKRLALIYDNIKAALGECKQYQ